MHDLDRTQLELNQYAAEEFESEEFESDLFESDQSLGAAAGEMDGEIDEVEEMELASQLLEVSDEAELDQFIGNLVKSAWGAARSIAAAPTGPRVAQPPPAPTIGGDLVKSLKKVGVELLPNLGYAVGQRFGGATGGTIGKTLGGAAGGALKSWLGLELEGL